MADQQQLDLLRQGVKDWNAWREQHPEIHPDLSYADLDRADLSGLKRLMRDLQPDHLPTSTS